MKSHSAVLSMSVFVAELFAQAPDTLWTRTYGGNSPDWANAVTTGSDENFIAAGATFSFTYGSADFWLQSTNDAGDSIWSRHYGGAAADECFDIIRTRDSGFVLGGHSHSFGHGNADFWVLKTNAYGDSVWSSTFGGGDYDRCTSVLESNDGYFFAGVTSSIGSGGNDFYLVKTNTSGVEVWSETYGGAYYDYCTQAILTSDGAVLLAGTSNSYGWGNRNPFLVKATLNGDTIWTRTYSASGDDWCTAVAENPDGGYVLGGFSNTQNASNYDIVVLRVDASGDLLWTKYFGGPSDDRCNSIIISSDGKIVIGGTTGTSESSYQYILQKIDQNGDSIWSQSLGGSNLEECFSLVQSTNGGYAMSGSTTSYGAGAGDVWLTYTSSDPAHDRIIRPNGSEALSIFSHDTIRWTGVGFDDGVSIKLNRHYPIGAWETITDSTENDGACEWFVTDPLSDSCRIRICALQDTFCDISDGNFSIVSSQGYLALVRSSQPGTALTGWNFGAVECPNAASQWFRLKNFGSESIVVFQPLEPATSEFSRNTPCGAFFALAPNQMSACSIRVVFDPANDGVYSDVLRVQTDAVNGVNGFVEFALAGEQISTPAAPEVVISTVGNNAVLRWSPIVESIGHCQIDPPSYLVFFSEDPDGPFWFHGGTNDTTYTHVWAIQHAAAMFYHVYAVQAEPGLLAMLPDWSAEIRMTEQEVLRLLR